MKRIMILAMLAILVASCGGADDPVAPEQPEQDAAPEQPDQESPPEQTDESNQALGDLAVLGNALDECSEFTQEFEHPFTGETHERRVLGLQDGACVYEETMPNDGLMRCTYDESDRTAVAAYYRADATPSDVRYDIDGESVSDPLAYAMSNGICVVEGY